MTANVNEKVKSIKRTLEYEEREFSRLLTKLRHKRESISNLRNSIAYHESKD